MDTPVHLHRSFARLGMRIKTQVQTVPAWHRRATFNIDVQQDRQGEHFLLSVGDRFEVAFQALDVQPDLNQLLLLARTADRKEKFLCGFDEHHLFTAAVPGQTIRSVRDAMSALKPPLVQEQERREGLRMKDRLRRRNTAFVRQGEWFFIPMPDLIVPTERIRRHEPLSRGAGSKPHTCAEAARIGGEVVTVCRHRPNGLSVKEYNHLITTQPHTRGWNWTQRVRNPELYVRGEVRHKDHATIHLNTWHRVLMNTENEAPGRQFVAFLD